MASKFDLLKNEVANLVNTGINLYYSMAESIGELPEEKKQELLKSVSNLPVFEQEYESWYSEALRLVKQIIPDRTEDFIQQYKNEKRKKITLDSYCISDFLLGISITSLTEIIVDRSAALPRMGIQVSILQSAQKRFESSLFDIKEILQADLFDSELDAARELAKKGFIRSGGNVAGVVLEKHLAHVCDQHGLKTRKSRPNLSNFYQLLYDSEVIDIPTWRFIQRLADIRNLCDHNKGREPTKEEVLELIEGTEKIIKTVF